MGKQIHFGVRRCQKYTLYEKMLYIRVVQLWIPYKKVNGHTCVSPSRVQLWGSKHCYLWSTIMYSVWAGRCQKICIIWSTFSYNSYFWQGWVLNWIYFSISMKYNIFDIYQSLEPLAPLWREILMCAHLLFCREFNSQQLLVEALFDIMCIFGCADRKVNLLSCVCAL